MSLALGNSIMQFGANLMRKIGWLCFALVYISLLAITACADPIITFEGFPDSTLLTNQYPGLTFSNTIILSAGISLNEFEFPPFSGVNVASDNGGPISIAFASPVLSLGGYFTYSELLTLQAFDASDNLVAYVTSAFANNEALSGDPGSTPNEFLAVSFPSGIAFAIITADPLGGSFALDDLTYTPVTTAISEPTSVVLFLSVIAIPLAKRQLNLFG